MKKYQFSKEKYLNTPANAAMYKTCKLLSKTVDAIDGQLVTLDAEGIGTIGRTYVHIGWCEEVPEPVDFMTAANSGKKIKYIEWGQYESVDDTFYKLHNSNVYALKDAIMGKWLIEC